MTAEPAFLDSARDDAEWVAGALAALAASKEGDLSAIIKAVGEPIVLAGSKATVRTYLVARDANGNHRVSELARRVSHQVIDYCIPRTRFNEANDHFNATRSSEKILALRAEAVRLFTKAKNSGEGGEMLLYFLLERLLRIPQLMSKMTLKTSTEMHIHGTDGVHVKALDGGRLALYWCESKLHASVSSAIKDCFESLAPYLLDDGTGPTETDLLLIRDHLDVGSEELRDALVRYFIAEDPKSLNVEFRGACLIGFDVSDYPDPDTANEVVKQALEEQIKVWHKRVAKRILAESIDRVELEVFLLPFPTVEAFRTAVRRELGIEPRRPEASLRRSQTLESSLRPPRKLPSDPSLTIWLESCRPASGAISTGIDCSF